jgi:hypothetical protein
MADEVRLPKPRENAGFFIFGKYFKIVVAVSENESMILTWQV